MNFKKWLLAQIETKRNKIAELQKRSDESTDINEVRAIGETLKTLRDEINDMEKQLENVDDDDEGNGAEPTGSDEGQRSQIPANAMRMNPLASFSTPAQQRENTSILDSMEYRTAFAKYVQTGEWTLEKRADETLLTSDIGKIIPNTVMQEFLKELKIYGNIYNRVRKLNVKGGVEFPIEDLVPTVTWITETSVSETKKAPEIKTSISFGYHIVEARLSQSLLSQVVSLSYLESEIAKLLAEAFVKEFDRVIIDGSGSGQPLGILKDERVKKENKISLTSTEMGDWTKWRSKFLAKIPLAYRGQGMFIMTANTWETYIMTLKDNNNRPLGVETFDTTDGTTTCRFMGREVQLVEPDILKDYDAAASGETWCIYFRPHDYAINTNLQIGFKRWFDDDKNKWVNKGLCIMDGKLLDVNGVYLFNK